MLTRSTTQPLGETLRQAIADALRAPSTHNSQPWRFRAHGHCVEVLADRTRALPVVDPDDRELTMSCGAALFHLRLALRARGLDVAVDYLPEKAEPDLIARLRVRPGHAPSRSEATLHGAIPSRHTSRGPYFGLTVPDELVERLRRDAEDEGAWLVPLASESQRIQLVALVMEADHVQWANPAFRRELASWMRPNDSNARDGIFGYAVGVDNVESHLAGMATRLLDRGSREAVRDRDLVEATPLMAVLGTNGDGRRDWVRAGEALDRVLLRAASEDLRAAFVNQAVESSDTRVRLGELTGRAGHPQVILRLGYGAGGQPSPRRPLSEVLE